MPKIGTEKKVKSNDAGNFTETKKFSVLFCGNVVGNNNKFYCIELQHDPKAGSYRLFTHYGRLGLSEVFGIRDDTKESPNSPITDFSFIEKEFDSIVKSKLRGKSIKDDKGTDESRRENYEEVETFSPKVGSPNIRGQSVTVTSTKKTAIDVSNIKNTKIVKFINQIVDENIHNITSLTTLTLTSNGLETPLGPVTKDQIAKAKAALTKLQSLLGPKDVKMNSDSQDVREMNNLYYSLIPHSFGHKITIDDWILESKKLIEEFDLLDQLESAVQMGSALNQNASQRLSAIGVDIDELADSHEQDRLRSYVANSKAQNHRGTDVWNWKVRDIFTIKIPNERARFETTSQRVGNVKELFHGSKNCNILSILKNGLIIPPHNAPGVTGRAFGSGIYFANASSKSLNYSIGFWSTTRNRYNNAFLFIAKVAMGRIFDTHIAMYQGIPSSYNSIWAHHGLALQVSDAGKSLYNDEFIVETPAQQSITHIIEMTK
jgi:poly [ADP-ribose] polymerase